MRRLFLPMFLCMLLTAGVAEAKMEATEPGAHCVVQELPNGNDEGKTDANEQSSVLATVSVFTVEKKPRVVSGHSQKKMPVKEDAVALDEEAGWEPEEADVDYVSQTVWGETRGCPVIEQRAQAWNILNRVDDERFPNTIAEVVTAPNQFQGYSPDNPKEPFHDMAREILIMWHNGEREIPADMVFCSGDGKHQTFRTDWIPNDNTRYYP